MQLKNGETENWSAKASLFRLCGFPEERMWEKNRTEYFIIYVELRKNKDCAFIKIKDCAFTITAILKREVLKVL